MTLARHVARTLSLGLPLVGSLVAMVLIGVTDAAMLGRYSVEALAAGTLGHTYFFTLYLLTSGFAFAVQGIAADATGRGDERAARRATRMALWLSALAGAAVMPAMIWSEPVLRALGQTEQVARDGEAYLRIAAWGLVPMLVMSVLRSHLSALERTRVVLWATLAAGALNMAVNWVLIFGNLGAPEMGIRGAAVASVAVQVSMAAALWAYAARGPGMARWALFRNLGRPDWPMLRRVAALGWPVGLTHLSESGLFAASALMMGWLGTTALAAHGIAIQIASAIFVVHLGLSQAATVRVGRLAGEADAAGLRRAAVAAILLSSAAVAAATVLYLGAGRWLIGLFLDRADPAAPAILGLGATLLVVAALFQLVDAAQVMALGMLRGLQDTRVPMVMAVVAYWGVGMPTGYVLGFPLGLGPVGIWLGLTAGLAVAAAALGWRLLRLLPPAERAPLTTAPSA